MNDTIFWEGFVCGAWVGGCAMCILICAIALHMRRWEWDRANDRAVRHVNFRRGE